MKTTTLTKTSLALASAAFLAATNASFASTVSLGSLTPFTGGDAGEGLDLTGNIIYAFNPGGTAQTVQGVNFAAAPVGAPPAGITTTAGLQFNYSGANPGSAAEYGSTANDNALEAMVTTAWYSPDWTIDLTVETGTEYQLQLILQEPYKANHGGDFRTFDIWVETPSPSETLAVDDLTLALEANGVGQEGTDFGLVFTYTFTAPDTSFQIRLDNDGDPQSPVLLAMTLEQVPEPSAVTLFGLGALGLLLRRRR